MPETYRLRNPQPHAGKHGGPFAGRTVVRGTRKPHDAVMEKVPIIMNAPLGFDVLHDDASAGTERGNGGGKKMPLALRREMVQNVAQDDGIVFFFEKRGLGVRHEETEAASEIRSGGRAGNEEPIAVDAGNGTERIFGSHIAGKETVPAPHVEHVARRDCPLDGLKRQDHETQAYENTPEQGHGAVCRGNRRTARLVMLSHSGV